MLLWNSGGVKSLGACLSSSIHHMGGQACQRVWGGVVRGGPRLHIPDRVNKHGTKRVHIGVETASLTGNWLNLIQTHRGATFLALRIHYKGCSQRSRFRATV
jgi:hypothetical protein